ncbi:MAG: alpha-N-acetylglucosaminidase [Bacteroidota bacterium]|nr:alpha-N-acetylglucosaminidase [Bacteroidota bacterium]
MSYYLGLLVMTILTFPATAQLHVQEIHDLIYRIIPQATENFTVEYISKEDGHDVFEVESSGGKIVLRGNNGVSAASALNYYLEHFCHCNITRNGTNLEMPNPLPSVLKKVHKVTPYKYRYYLNYCTFNYTMAWWDWDRWQKEIDWMALNGINMPLALTGEEAIWQKVYESVGFSRDELKSFFSGPAYFAWLWMGNLDGWGGPLPQHWIDTHEALQKKILARERVLGMTSVLPAFSGHVPPTFKEKFPKAQLKKTNWGYGFNDVYILDPSDSLFITIGKKFIETQTSVYGTDHLYSADTFNENDPPSNDSTYLDAMSKKIFQSMASSDPQAVWVMQGWMFSYNERFWQPRQMQALLNAIPNDHMIILDLFSEANPVWNRTNAYYGKPWIWNLLSNFGGNSSLFGRMRHVTYDPAIALHDPEAGKMTGIGLTPESIEQNPALYQLMTENVWRSEPIDLDIWLKSYSLNRYGRENMQVNAAWQILKNTVYSASRTGDGGPESIITGRPTFERNTTMTNTSFNYNPLQLIKAWDLFIGASDSLKNSDGFQFDLVDITRQVLANYATPLQQEFVKAYLNNDIEKFDIYSRQFLDLITDMDDLLGTRKDFLLGHWLDDARKCGITDEEKNLYEFNARDLITLWGNRDCPIHDYANRQWSGLLKGFYEPRWEMFFQYVDSCLQNNLPVDMKVFDERVKDFEWQWVNGHETYPVNPSNDPVTMSKVMYRKYLERINQMHAIAN